ncbi:C45 family peptidase [Saccharopolyspora sp. K220]|uniref:C45 family autoproteolytic acyltransferase/hydolase n=1 Tax=Saccharopolyspora soli TaxID=2926618 RepID=UPI001F59BF16|nr:C45 family peptidase [Saccharopolyspora soli]MCI2423344.1 C45 family peptidase [Saccharopolyspora soli]
MSTEQWQDWGLRADAPTTTADPRFIDVAGTPQQQGITHGIAAHDLIAANIAAVRRDVAELCTDDAARQRYRKCLDANAEFVRTTAPDAWAELTGIAEGSGIPLADILALNLPAHMVLRWVPNECTQIAVTGQRAAGRTLVAKTRDMSGNFVEHVALRRRYGDGRRLAEVTVAGSILWPGSGINDSGVAMSTSGVWSAHTAVDWRDSATGWILINSHDLLLKARSAAEFVELLWEQPRLSGLNMVVADLGETLGLEVTRDHIVHREPADVHVLTNHYVCDPLAALSPAPAQYPSSYLRRQRADELLAARPEVTAGDLAQLFADEHGGPHNSLARRQIDGVGAETTYASIAELPSLAFHVVLGNPADADRTEGPR